eukprot:CAMPEP_0184691528 /NCGR_PEP_ID=MMETSP0313-20130426/352_1 /TAXON_ID=2792 /ORGANISM="Porphyridium aerugineum, Strain SAG 1380-2" /LENGTH=439 /DNA_ID=CAMNT_0027149267 /DNA_START=199 /DNA_END=1518 /DNA_ORIENTATION=+
MGEDRAAKKIKTSAGTAVAADTNNHASNHPVKAVILVGGGSKGTRFRPLSMDCPKPLFIVAGMPMVEHHVKACAKVPNMQEIYLMGFYEEELFHSFMDYCKDKYGVRITYLKESVALGTAGGLNRYRDVILSGNPVATFVLHCDIACSFPLVEMLAWHEENKVSCTVLGKELSFDEAHKYGEMVTDPETHEMVHYAEKPQSNISPIINGGIYIFSKQIFDHIHSVSEMRDPAHVGDEGALVRLEQDVLMPLAGKKMIYVFKTNDFWGQIKAPPQALVCSGLYMDYFKKMEPELLTAPASTKMRASRGMASAPSHESLGSNFAKLDIVGTCMIHPSAKVSPDARIGPNVSIAAGCVIGSGVRLQNCLILEDVVIQDHAYVKNAIIGWRSNIGSWTRAQGSVDKPTIFGAGVTAKSEVIIDRCIVLPHKGISTSCSEEIIL